MVSSKINSWILYHRVFILLFICVISVSGQDPVKNSKIRKEVVPLLFEYNLEQALSLCNNYDQNEIEVIAIKSVIYSLKGNRDKNNSEIEKGFNMLKPYKSLKSNFNIHVALAVSYGIQANHSGLKEKIELSELSVHHCKQALKLDPDLPHPNFILGRFYYELSDMNKVTANLAKSIIDKEEIERASFELALSYLEKASKLVPSRFLYNYYTGAVCNKLEDEKKAQYYFRLADKNKRCTADDEKADKDLQKQLH